MTREFVVADPHWGHEGVCKFLNADGSKLRPWDNAKDMDAAMLDLWNQTVAPKDKVYVLGDWCINRKHIVQPVNGDLILIKGNHDIFKLEEYTKIFRDIRAYHVLGAHRTILSHIPVHTSQLERWRLNIHGHLHGNVVTRKLDGPWELTKPDERYRCVSMERINFKPMLLEEALS